jgi:collagen type III alpha
MDPADIRMLASEFAPLMKDFVSRSMAPVMARLDAVERRFSDIPAPRDGKDADPEAVSNVVFLRLRPEIDAIKETLATVPENISAAVQALPLPKHGDPGVDGKDGAPGAPGQDGRDGIDGKSVALEDIAPLVEKAFDAIQKPVDGINGKDGAPGRDGKDGAPGADGQPGRDGLGLAAGLIGRDGRLVFTMSNGETRDIGEIVGRDGKDGKDGANGLDGKDGAPGRDGIDGKDGAPGASVTPADVVPMLQDMVSKAVSELPAAEKGEPGKSVSLEEVLPHILDAATKAVDAIPKPKDGVTLEEITPVLEGMVEKRVAAIPVPKDGASLVDGFINDEGRLVLVMPTGAKTLSRVVGKDAEAPAMPAMPDFHAVPDEVNEQVAKAIRLMAETPVSNAAQAAVHAQTAHAVKNQPDVHIHLPEHKVANLEIVMPDPKPQEVNVAVEVKQPPKRKTMKTVKEFDGNGRIKKILEEEI